MTTEYQLTPPWPLDRSFKQRASGWDYTQSATYGLTFHTFEDQALFGAADIGGHFQLSPIGEAVLWFWRTVPDHQPMEVQLHALELTPCSLHAVIGIRQPSSDVPSNPTPSTYKRRSLSQLIRGYKSAVTRSVRELGWWPREAPLWRAGYGDCILHGAAEQYHYAQVLLERSNGQAWTGGDLAVLEAPAWVAPLLALQAERRAAWLIAQTECSAAD